MQFLDPQKVIQHFLIAPGMRVAELHAGSGHFTPLIKKAAGEYGNVHSFQYDKSQDFFSLPELADRAIIINIPFDGAHHGMFSRAYRLLKPHGKMIFIEMHGDHVTQEQAMDFAGIAGFLHERRFNAGDHHFGLVFKRI